MRRGMGAQVEDESTSNDVCLDCFLYILSEELQKLNQEINYVGHKKNRQKFRYSQVIIAQKLKDQRHNSEKE